MEVQKEKKYELIKSDWIEIIDSEHKKHVLFRIRSIKNFEDVKIGDYGGYVESEDNLNQYDDSWIYSDAVRISKNARAWGNARVYGKAKMYNSSEICDYGIICDTVKLHDNCKVHGRAKIYGNCYIGGVSEVSDKCQINGSIVDVRGNVRLLGNAMISGDIRMDGVVVVSDNVTIKGDNIFIGGHSVLRHNVNIRDHAHIVSNDDFIAITNIGHKRDVLTSYLTKERAIMVTIGDTVTTLNQFLSSSDEYMTSTEIVKNEYNDFLDAAKKRFIRTRPVTE